MAVITRITLRNLRQFRILASKGQSSWISCSGTNSIFVPQTSCLVPLRRVSFKSQYDESVSSAKILLPRTSSKVLIRNSSSKKEDDKEEEKEEKKLTLFQKFKMMYRDYWYVLVPVHLVTSSIWFGSFYYLAKSGVDIAGILESWHVSQKITSTFRDSSMGYIAVAYALYKIATPARYTVTLGGTTISINYLKKWGLIKPVPSKQEIKDMIQKKKDDLISSPKEFIKDMKKDFGKVKPKDMEK